MSLKNTNQQGFTIVELLIVIVVIAILAAISIVAFTGVQQRGRDSARASDVNSISKALTAYTADGGAWPADATTEDTGARDVLADYETANISQTILNKLGTTPTSGAPDTYGYTRCPAAPATQTGVTLTWYKEQGGAGVQSVVVGSC